MCIEKHSKYDKVIPTWKNTTNTSLKLKCLCRSHEKINIAEMEGFLEAKIQSANKYKLK